MMLRINKKRPFSYGGNLYEPYKSNEWYTRVGLPLYAFGLAMNNIGGSLKPKVTSTTSGGTGDTEDITDLSKGFEVGVSTTNPLGYEAAYGGNLYSPGGWMNISDMSTKTGKVLGGAGSVLGMAGAGFQGFSGSASMNDAAINTALQLTILKLNKTVSANSFDALSKDWSMNRLAATNYNSRNFRSSDGSRVTSTLGSVASGAMAGSTFGPIGAVVGGAVGLGSSIAGMITGNAKARKLAREANRTNLMTNALTIDKYLDRANYLRKKMNKSLARSFVADGGELNFGQYLNGYAKGGTLFAIPLTNTALGYSLLNQALLNNEDDELSPVLFGFGGNLGTNGTNFTDGLTYFNVPTRHETNPNGGIPLGIAPDGKPNLVEGKEEDKKGDGGEIKWNKLEYIFSDRLTPSLALIDRWKLPKLFLEYTYADLVRKAPIVKEAEMRPNHPDSLNAMDLFLASVAEDQETTKKEKEAKEMQDQLSLMSDLDIAALGMQMAQLKLQELQAPEELGQQPVDYLQLEKGDQLDYQEDLEALALMATQDGMALPYVGAALGGHLNAEGGNMTALGETIPALTQPDIIDLPATAPEEMGAASIQGLPMVSPMEEPQAEMPLEAPVEESTSLWDTYPEAAEMSTKLLNQAIEDITAWAKENKDKLMLRDARRVKKGSREDKEEFVDESLDIIREEEQLTKQEEQPTSEEMPMEQPQEAPMPLLTPQMMAEGGEMAPTEETALVPLEEMSADTEEPLPAPIEEILNLLLQLSELLGISAEEEYTPQIVELLLQEALKLGMNVSALEALGPAKTANLLNQFKALLASQIPELQPQLIASPLEQMSTAAQINPLEAMMAAQLEDLMTLLGIPFGFGGAFPQSPLATYTDPSQVIEQLKQSKDVKDISTEDIANVLLLNEALNRLLGYQLPVIYRYGGGLSHRYDWGGFTRTAILLGFAPNADPREWLLKYYPQYIKPDATNAYLVRMAIALRMRDMLKAGNLPKTLDLRVVASFLKDLKEDPVLTSKAIKTENPLVLTVTAPVENKAPETPVTPKKQEVRLAALLAATPQREAYKAPEITPFTASDIETPTLMTAIPTILSGSPITRPVDEELQGPIALEEDIEDASIEELIQDLLEKAAQGDTEAAKQLLLYLEAVSSTPILEGQDVITTDPNTGTTPVIATSDTPVDPDKAPNELPTAEERDKAAKAVLRYYKKLGLKESDISGDILLILNEDILTAVSAKVTSYKDLKLDIDINKNNYHVSSYDRNSASAKDILEDFKSIVYDRGLYSELKQAGADDALLDIYTGLIRRPYYTLDGKAINSPQSILVTENPYTYDLEKQQWLDSKGNVIEDPFGEGTPFDVEEAKTGRDWSKWGYYDKEGTWHDVPSITNEALGNTELHYVPLDEWFKNSGLDVDEYENSDEYLNNYLDFTDDIYAGNKSALLRLYDLGELSKDKNGKNRYFKEGVDRENLSIDDILKDKLGNNVIEGHYVSGGDPAAMADRQFYRTKDNHLLGPNPYSKLGEEEKKEYTPLDHKGLTREERLAELRAIRDIYPQNPPVDDDLLFSAMFDNNAALAYLMGKRYEPSASRYALVNSEGKFIDEEGNLTDTPLLVDYDNNNELYDRYGTGPIEEMTDALGRKVSTYGVTGRLAPVHLMLVGNKTVVLTPTQAAKYSVIEDTNGYPQVENPIAGYTGDVIWHNYTTPEVPVKEEKAQKRSLKGKLNFNIGDLTGLVPFLNRPFLEDYRSANQLANSANNLTWMSAPRHGEYQKFIPLDILSDVYLAKDMANALNRGIMNMSAGNTSLGLANMAYNNAQTLAQIAKMRAAAEEEDFKRRGQVHTQHNEVDKTWDAYALLADQANMQNNSYIHDAAIKAADRTYEILKNNNESKSKWLSNMLLNIQNRGIEDKQWTIFDNAMLSGIGAPGFEKVYTGVHTPTGIPTVGTDSKGEYFMENGKKVYFERKSEGGPLIIKRKRRLTSR